MGRNRYYRHFLRSIRPSAFYSRSRFSWPEGKAFVTVEDVNGLLRAYGLDPTGTAERGARIWGDFVGRLGHDLSQQYAAGASTAIVVLDGPAPPAKHATQKKRAAAKKNGKRKREDGEEEEEQEDATAAGPARHKWPHVPNPHDPEFLRLRDSPEWFVDGARVQVGSLDEVYYEEAPKIKFTQYVCEYLLHRFELPVGRRLVLDCGWTYEEGRLPRAVHVRWAARGAEDDTNGEPLLHDDAARHTLERMREAGGASRVVEFLPGAQDYGAVVEADDRLAHWVYALQDRVEVVVCSIDQDTLGALMLTSQVRCELSLTPRAEDAPRLWWKSRCTSETVDIDDLAWTLEHHLGYLLDPKAPAEFHVNPVLLFELVSLLKESDYAYAGYHRVAAEGEDSRSNPAILPGPGPRNTLRPLLAADARALFSRLVAGTPRAVRGIRASARDHLERPCEALVSREAFRAYLRACFAEAYRERPVFEPDGRTPKVARSGPNKGFEMTRRDSDPKKSPALSPAEADAVCARVAWALDKSLNGGRPGYRLADECAVDAASGRPCYGFESYEPDSGAFRVRPALRVAPLDFYGVRQELPPFADGL
jgi:hypothetical protein